MNATRARVVVGIALSSVLTSGCSLFSPSVSCGAPESIDLLTQLVGEAPATGTALMSAHFNNDPAKMMTIGLTLASAKGLDALEPIANTVIAFSESPKDFMTVDSIVTRDKKSNRSVSCEAQVHFRESPPQTVTPAVWNAARETSWSVDYTADRTDDGKQVLVKVSNSQCRGPACDALLGLAPLFKQLKDNKETLLDSIKSARGDNSEAVAIHALRAINHAESLFESCGGGGYAQSIEDLARPLDGTTVGFIQSALESLGGDTDQYKNLSQMSRNGVIIDGYAITLSADAQASVTAPAEKTCNGSTKGAVSSYFAEAHPVGDNSAKRRSFATDTRVTIFVNDTGAVIAPGMAGASVLQ